MNYGLRVRKKTKRFKCTVLNAFCFPTGQLSRMVYIRESVAMIWPTHRDQRTHLERNH